MTRRQRFDAYRRVLRLAGGPFAYGTNDCVVLIGRAVRELTGVDHLTPYLPYDTFRARRLLRQAGGIVGLLELHLGEPQPLEELARIRVCDPVVVADQAHPPCGGLWNGSSVTCFSEHGMTMIRPQFVEAWWEVG